MYTKKYLSFTLIIPEICISYQFNILFLYICIKLFQYFLHIIYVLFLYIFWQFVKQVFYFFINVFFHQYFFTVDEYINECRSRWANDWDTYREKNISKKWPELSKLVYLLSWTWRQLWCISVPSHGQLWGGCSKIILNWCIT